MCDKIRKQKLQELIKFSQELDLYNIQENESKEQQTVRDTLRELQEALNTYGMFNISPKLLEYYLNLTRKAVQQLEELQNKDKQNKSNG